MLLLMQLPNICNNVLSRFSTTSMGKIFCRLTDNMLTLQFAQITVAGEFVKERLTAICTNTVVCPINQNFKNVFPKLRKSIVSTFLH